MVRLETLLELGRKSQPIRTTKDLLEAKEKDRQKADVQRSKS